MERANTASKIDEDAVKASFGRNVTSMALSLALAPIGGWLVDAHDSAGYLCVFVVGATLSLCTLIGFLLIVREPRTGQELYVRLRKF